jgi:ferredoxin
MQEHVGSFGNMVSDSPPESGGRQRAVVDRDACMGSGNCVYWAPAVFDLDDDGVAFAEGDIAGNEEAVEQAIGNCPTRAISLESDPT